MGLTLAGSSAIFLYLTAGLLLGRRLGSTSGLSTTLRSGALVSSALAVLIHAAVLYLTLFTTDGLNLAFFHALSLTAWLITALLTLLAIRQPVENLGIVLLPGAAITVMFQLVFVGEPPQLITVKSPIQAHIILSIAAYGTLTLAAMQAILLSIQNRQLHNHRPGGFMRALPPLKVMEDLLFHMIGIGTALLALSLLSGAFFLEDIFAQHLVHKTVLSILAWLLFSVLLWG
ncbi:MAG: cytochrome C assembly family protein, partial [Gammaproteobacteria bacterium]